MDLQLNDVVEMKKQHPCGNREFLILDAGTELHMRCLGCGREFATPRVKAERYIKKVKRNGGYV